MRPGHYDTNHIKLQVQEVLLLYDVLPLETTRNFSKVVMFL
jgi:hypothetical protein